MTVKIMNIDLKRAGGGKKPRLQTRNHTGKQPREKKNKNQNETANIDSKLAQNCVVSDFSSIKMAQSEPRGSAQDSVSNDRFPLFRRLNGG